MNSRIAIALLGLVALIGIGVYAIFALGLFSTPDAPTPEAAPVEEGEERISIRSEEIHVPPPPERGSEEEERDLAILLESMEGRSPEVVAALSEEIPISVIRIGEHTISEYQAGEKYPKLAEVLSYTMPEFTRILKEKQLAHTRPYPSQIATAIKPLIALEGQHIAYPPDYSATTHYVALVLGEINPEGAADYLSKADEVSIRREIAAVQYPFDNAIGALFAEQFFEAAKRDAEFSARIEAARAEWKASGGAL